MKVILVGNGKFAKDISKHFLKSKIQVLSIENVKETQKFSSNFIVYVGSERNMEKAQTISRKNKIPIIFLSTNFNIKNVNACIYQTVNSSFQVKSFIESCLSFYKCNKVELVSIIESHQKNKKDVSSTAKLLCDELKTPYKLIKSVRKLDRQLKLGIPKKYLDSHAYHKVTFRNGKDIFNFEIMILGKETYIRGIIKIMDFIKGKKYKVGLFKV